MAKLVSKTYGEALYEVAMESGEDKAIQLMEEINDLMKILEENPDFHKLMKHPGIAKQEKLENGYRIVANCGEDGGQTVGHIHFHMLAQRNLSWPPG